MTKEINNEVNAIAISNTLGLHITKKNGIYIVGNDVGEICRRYNMGYCDDEEIFYDNDYFALITDHNQNIITIKDKYIVDASKLELPYRITDISFMFEGTSRLEIPPVLPNTVEYCDHTFDVCTRLKVAPKLHEGVLSCLEMFACCISLEIPPEIPESVVYCSKMFHGCKMLKKEPVFPINSITYRALDDTPFERTNSK